MTTVQCHNPKTVVFEHGSRYWWLTITDNQGSKVSVHFGGEQARAAGFAAAVTRAAAWPGHPVDIKPEEQS